MCKLIESKLTWRAKTATESKHRGLRKSCFFGLIAVLAP